MGYYNFENCKKGNLCFFGTFESPKYFENIKSQLQDEFTPKYGVLHKNISLYKKINETNSVCVTIRRGDFVSNLEYKKNLYVCTPEYFKKAIKVIQKKVLNPTFFIFSDDIDWVKKIWIFLKILILKLGMILFGRNLD